MIVCVTQIIMRLKLCKLLEQNKIQGSDIAVHGRIKHARMNEEINGALTEDAYTFRTSR